MTDEQYTSMDQAELMKRMKAIASDLWGSVAPNQGAEEAPGTPKAGNHAPAQPREPRKPDIRSLWKTADETIDWTDALAHASPTDGLTGPKLWAFYHQNAAKVLEGDLEAYTRVLQKANPLGELTEYADGITMHAVSPDRLESGFTCDREMMGENRKLYLSAMGLRIARDLLACLPVEEVHVTGEDGGKAVFSVTFTRQQLLHRNFVFTDPVALAEECGAEFK